MNNEEPENLIFMLVRKFNELVVQNWRILSTGKLIIKHFGAIDNIVLELKPNTVFIGPQSSGKSTIAKLIDIFRNLQFLLVFNDPSQQEISTKDFLSFFEHHQLQNFFHEDTELEYYCDEYHVYYADGEFKLIFMREESENQNLKLLRDIAIEVNSSEKLLIS